MKKKSSAGASNQPKIKKKQAKKNDSTPENLPPKEKFPLNQQERGSAQGDKQNPPSPHKKPYEQQSQGIDQNVIPEHTGRIPDERRDEVEEKSRNL